LQQIADSHSAQMVGLEYRVKSEESLARKIADRAADRARLARGMSMAEAVRLESQNDRSMNDVLRYTFVVSEAQYATTHRETIAALEAQGFHHLRDFNAWERVGTRTEMGYRGINSTFRAPNGQLFELQFHTAETVRMKTELHSLYEEWRATTTTAARRQELDRLMRERWRTVPVPPGMSPGAPRPGGRR
jgi:hypothetical protein